ncbi:MAG: NAD(P)-dependent oxidoreductase [Caldilineaceae bacterium]
MGRRTGCSARLRSRPWSSPDHHVGHPRHPDREHIFAFLLAFGRNLLGHGCTAGAHLGLQPLAGQPLVDHPAGAEVQLLYLHQAVFELAGKTMLLVGVGAIGLHTSAAGPSLRPARHRPTSPADRALPHVDRVVGPDELRSVLPEADFVVVTAPLTPETAGMFDAAAFAAMQPSAYFVNIGRGGTVVEPDLIAALQNGAIAGAGLDVFAEEPLPPESPLWDLPNVIITSHYSGLSPEYDARALEIFLDNLHRYRAGEPMTNVVDKRLVY